jgi:hypothetical protein
MAVIWNLGYDFTNGGQHSGWGVLNNAFDAGAILPGATSTQFHLKDGQNLITFKGNFVVNGGVVQSGTITGFDAYYGNSTNHLIEASGHSISFSAFNQGLVAFKTNNPFPLYELIFGQPMTVNGSNLPASGEIIIGGFAADRLHGNQGDEAIFDMGGDDLIVGGSEMIGWLVIPCSSRRPWQRLDFRWRWR